MLVLVLPVDIKGKLLSALVRAGDYEVGGILMAAHIGPDLFEIQDITIHRQGALASFMRRIEDALGRLHSFFSTTQRQYNKFNYIGEWHSHPMFSLEPSNTDDASMYQIVNDPKVGANFLVLLIVKLNSHNNLMASAHTYLPGGIKYRAEVKIDN